MLALKEIEEIALTGKPEEQFCYLRELLLLTSEVSVFNLGD